MTILPGFTLTPPDWALTTSTAVIRATTADNGLEVAQDWDTPVTLTTVMGSLQPASEAALTRAGLTGPGQRYEWFGLVASIDPVAHRLLIGGTQYVVLDVREWGTHTEALVEVARAT